MLKYVNQLNDDELREVYELLVAGEGTVYQLNIYRADNFISLEGSIIFPEFDEEILAENPDATIYVNDCYEITDYHASAFDHEGIGCTHDYREYMYKKFGDAYAREFLLNC